VTDQTSQLPSLTRLNQPRHDYGSTKHTTFLPSPPWILLAAPMLYQMAPEFGWHASDSTIALFWQQYKGGAHANAFGMQRAMQQILQSLRACEKYLWKSTIIVLCKIERNFKLLFEFLKYFVNFDLQRGSWRFQSGSGLLLPGWGLAEGFRIHQSKQRKPERPSREWPWFPCRLTWFHLRSTDSWWRGRDHYTSEVQWMPVSAKKCKINKR